MPNHGVYVSEQATSVGTPLVAPSGVPFVIGAAPVQSAGAPAAAGRPVLCTSWDDFVAAFGYSDVWTNYNLCEFAYSHFKLFGCQPAIFCNLLDPSTHKTAQAASDLTVANHRVSLPLEAINDSALVVKASGGQGTAYTKDTDYVVFYSDENCIVELLSTGSHYSEAALNIAYNKVTPASVTANAVATGMENIELCMTTVGVVPDLIVSPGFSKSSSVAAVMAAKAAGINGVFGAKAIIDVDSSTGHAVAYSGVAAEKASASLTDENEICCWPCMKLGDKQFWMSTQLAGLMAYVDSENGCPYETPSNKGFKMDGLCLSDGTEVVLTKAQADTVVNAGVVTALNFLASGWVCWGSYAACYPAKSDVKDIIIPISRMFDWVGNTLVKTFWGRIDDPLNRRLLDTILDTCNIWLNGLVGSGYMLGARIEMLDAENPLTDLMAGKIKLHIYMTPPAPAQEIDFVLEYDASYVEAAFS